MRVQSDLGGRESAVHVDLGGGRKRTGSATIPCAPFHFLLPDLLRHPLRLLHHVSRVVAGVHLKSMQIGGLPGRVRVP